MAYHALEVMESVLASAHTGAAVRIHNTVEPPESVELTVLARDVDVFRAQAASQGGPTQPKLGPLLRPC